MEGQEEAIVEQPCAGTYQDISSHDEYPLSY